MYKSEEWRGMGQKGYCGVKMAEQKELEKFQEKKKHGSMLFPFDIYPCTIPGDFPSVSLHWQKSMEIIYIKKGEGKIQTGREVTEAKSGDIYVLPPGTLHALYGIFGQTMEYENIIFDINFLGGGAADICDQEYLVPLTTGQLLLPVAVRSGDECYAEIAGCLSDAEEFCRTCERGYELGVKASMLRMLFVLLHCYPDPPSLDSPDMERLKAALFKIETGFSDSITVTDMAESCGCSNSHFMRWFKQMTGTSFTAYLNERRLAAAAEALRKTDDKILVIAEGVGFENLSNFNRQFKKRYGITPREYRGR